MQFLVEMTNELVVLLLEIRIAKLGKIGKPGIKLTNPYISLRA